MVSALSRGRSGGVCLSTQPSRKCPSFLAELPLSLGKGLGRMHSLMHSPSHESFLGQKSLPS